MTQIPTLTRMATYFLTCRLGVMKFHRLPGQPRAGSQMRRAEDEAWETTPPPFLGSLSSSVGYPDYKLANRKTINFSVKYYD